MQSLKFSLHVFFFIQNIWENFEMDNRRRRSGYAIPEVFFPCFLLFQKNWGNFETGNMRRRIGYAIPDVFFMFSSFS